jgi:hypothetical protein
VRPSYPVYIDSVGWQSNQASGFQKWWIAGNTPNIPYAIPRRPLYIRRQEFLNTTGTTMLNRFHPLGNPLIPSNNFGGTWLIMRNFGLLDDLTFNPDGTATVTGVAPRNVVQRQGRYTWAYMVRRPNNLVARQIELTVVVYSGRSIDVPSSENAYLTPPATDAEVVPAAGGVTSIALDYTGRPKPALRRGWWVLDTTMTPIPQGYFYRVVDVNDDTPNRLRLELQTPVRAAGNPQRVFAVLDNVTEVFEKGTIDPKEEIRPF